MELRLLCKSKKTSFFRKETRRCKKKERKKRSQLRMTATRQLSTTLTGTLF